MSVDAVAKEAGVSTATVSRVFSGSPLVRMETVELVKAAAERLNYQHTRRRRPGQRPDFGRSSSLRRQTKTLAIVSLNITRNWLQNPALSKAVNGIQREASARGFRVMLEELLDPSKPFGPGENGEIDGAIVFVPGTITTVAQLEEMVGRLRKNVPVVWCMGAWLKQQTVDHVTVSNFAIGFEAFQYLHELNCKRIAFVTTWFDLMIMRLRYHGLIGAAFEARERVQIYARSSDGEIEATEGGPLVTGNSTSEMVSRLVNSPDRPDGIFFGSDRVAASVVPLLSDHGLVIGRDIQGVSVDFDETLLAALRVPLASFDIKSLDVGATAVRRLCELIDNPQSQPVHIEIPAKLVLPDRVPSITP